jgi:two-component system cell cycle response regulator DivK
VKRRIALIEDNFENRLLARLILAPHYQVAEYETGGAAIAGFVADPPDLLLLDISLPDMDGTELLAHVREDGALRHLPVIAFTAHASDQERSRFLALGFDEYISKPITDKTAMLKLIEHVLASHAAPAAE